VKPDGVAAIQALVRLGVEVAMLTGDNRRTAHAIAAQVGITNVLAEVKPEGKVAEVERLQAAGHRVAMVGDGVNDAAALAQADLGIAMGSAAAVAVEAADLTVLSGDLEGVGRALALARFTYSVILQNLGWALGYNLLALPLAAFGLLSPDLAGLAMGLSSFCVVGNSLRVNRFGRATRARAGGAARGRLRLPRRSDVRSRRLVGVLGAWIAPAVLLGALVAATPGRFLVETRQLLAPAGQELTITTGPDLPDIYTLSVADHHRIQAYVEVSSSQLDEFHVTVFGPGSGETPVSRLTVVATSASLGSAGRYLPVRKLDTLGHFVADVENAPPGSYRFVVTALGPGGAVIQGALPIPLR